MLCLNSQIPRMQVKRLPALHPGAPCKMCQAVPLVPLCSRQVPAVCVVLHMVHDHMVQAVRAWGHPVQRGQDVRGDGVQPACKKTRSTTGTHIDLV